MFGMLYSVDEYFVSMSVPLSYIKIHPLDML